MTNFSSQAQLSPMALMERFITENHELLHELEADKEFNSWFDALKATEQINAQSNMDFLHYLSENEPIGAEKYTGDLVYLDSDYQGPFTYKILKKAGASEAARLLKNRRDFQFTEFGKESYDRKTPGLHLYYEDEAYQPSAVEKKNLKEFNRKFVKTCFFPSFERRPDFTKFLAMAFNDFFDVDDISMEIRRTLGGMPLAFHLADPNTIYHVTTKNDKRYERWDREDVYKKIQNNGSTNLNQAARYVMMKNEVRLASFTDSEMMKEHFFTSSDYHSAYRGFSIVEQGIKLLMNIMNALNYNSSNFNNNRTPQGILAFSGGFANRTTIEQFKKIVYAYLGGAVNRHKIPIIGLPERGDGKFIPFGGNSKDMEFHFWIGYLHTIFCQLSGTNPEEVSVASHQTIMGGKKLFDQAPDGILQISKDQGLNTFLRYFASIINKSGVLRKMFGAPIVCRFNGLEVEDEKIKTEVQKQKLATTKSYNQMIIEDGGEPQVLMRGGLNVYDVVGYDGAMGKVVEAIAQEKLQEAMAKAQADASAAAGNNGGQGGGVAPDLQKDKNLVSEYGPPQ